MDIFSVIIEMIAGIGVLNLLLMAVFERTREIGLLGAMGLKPRQIATLFILEGTMIGVVGVVAGAVLGVAVNAALGRVGFDYSSFASVAEFMALINGRVYPTLGLSKLFGRAVTILIITTLAACIPAREACPPRTGAGAALRVSQRRIRTSEAVTRSRRSHVSNLRSGDHTMNQLFKMAFRDLGRNKRRSLLSALAVTIGTALLLFMAATLRGEMHGAIQNNIRLQTGHLQIRAASYDESKIQPGLGRPDRGSRPGRRAAQGAAAGKCCRPAPVCQRHPQPGRPIQGRASRRPGSGCERQPDLPPGLARRRVPHSRRP